MKKLFLLLIFTFTVQSALAHACGIHYIKYVGTVDLEGLTIESIELPNIPFFYGIMEIEDEGTLFPTAVESDCFSLEIPSHLTSPVRDVKSLLHLYKNKREKVPILVTIKKNGVAEKVRLELDWKDIRVTQIEKKGGFPRFEFNLGALKL